MTMDIESFNTLPLQEVIKSYLYQEYATDDDLQAFVDAYNSLAQGYHGWFLANPLGLYTAAGISGALLDWIALGIYGIARPTLASQSTIITAGYDSTAYDTVPYNYLSYSSSGSAEQTTDDIFKRILTWNLYRGDGQVFTVQWLKNRVARFLHGAFGADCPVLNFQPSVTIAGSTFTVTDFASSYLTALRLSLAAYALAFPFQYQLAFVGIAFTNAGGVLTLSQALYFPTSATGLAPGSVWDSAGSIKVVPGVTPDPHAPALKFATTDPNQLLTLGGGNLPTSNPGVTGQLWNNAGTVSIS